MGRAELVPGGLCDGDVSLRLETGSSGIDETAVTPMELITTKNTGDVNGPGTSGTARPMPSRSSRSCGMPVNPAGPQFRN